MQDKKIMKDENLIKKSETLKAYLFSLLIMLGGAVAWGLIYCLGFFSAWVAILPSFFAMGVALKYLPNRKAGIFAYVLILSVIFNYMAMCIAATIQGMILYDGFSFGEMLSLVFSASITGGIVDTICCVLFTALGVVLGFVWIRARNKKQQAEKQGNPNVSMPIQNNENGNTQEIVTEVRNDESNSVEEKANKMIEEISVYVAMYKNKLVQKEEFLKLLEKYRQSVVLELDDEEKLNIVLACANKIEDEDKEYARKILIKFLSK